MKTMPKPYARWFSIPWRTLRVFALAWAATVQGVRPDGAPPTPDHFGEARFDSRTGIVTADGAGGLRIKSDRATGYRFEARLKPSVDIGRRQQTGLALGPEDATNFNSPALWRVLLARDREGCVLTAQWAQYDPNAQRWTRDRHDQANFTFWPSARAGTARARLEADGIEPHTWHGKTLALRVDVLADRAWVWLEGHLVREISLPENGLTEIALHLGTGDEAAGVRLRPLENDSRFIPLDLAPMANARLALPDNARRVVAGPVPFELAADGVSGLDLREARWVDQERDPASFRAEYDGGPYFLHDPRTPFLRVPKDDYIAAHLLAVAADDAALTDAFTLRAGRFGFGGQVLQFDFPGRAPRQGAVDAPAPALNTPAGPLFHVVVPMDKVIAQDIEAGFIEIELTREVRLARRKPDPNRFNYRPLGLPSALRIAAITLERSPIAMRVGSRMPGHVFEEPSGPEFQVELGNRTPEPRDWQLEAIATHFDGSQTRAVRSGRIAAGAQTEVALQPPVDKRGYHELDVVLRDATGNRILRRKTSFAVLAPDTRAHRDRSPFGTWDFGATHFSLQDVEVIGPLYVKLGLRYGMWSYSAGERARFGVIRGNELAIRSGSPKPDGNVVERYRQQVEAHPDTLPRIMMFHENSISGPHVTRVPDLFHDRAPYRLNEAEQERFDAMFELAVNTTRAIREHLPGVAISLGNGTAHVLETFYQHKFPPELFDAAGNEPGSYGRPPEAQPPDFTANNASIWMDRQLLDAYGYQDKPVEQCYEVIYPGTNPGNLTPAVQADYYVRHGLHSLAWEMPLIRFGLLHDVGTSYRFSNWGSSAFMRSRPEINPKPSYVSIAVMTRALDGAVFERVLPLGSASLYGFEFRLPDGRHVAALYTLRGRRPLTLAFARDESRVLTDGQGNEQTLSPDEGRITVTLSPTPVFLTGQGAVVSASAGTPVYEDRPAGPVTRIAALDTLDDWTVENGRDHVLEYHNHTVYRRRGDFAIDSIGHFEGRDGVLRVRMPASDAAPSDAPLGGGRETMPMYQALTHRNGVEIPGTPTEIGLWVNGNSGWGRIIFDLEDASGQRWTSIGAMRTAELHPWMLDWMPREVLEDFQDTTISDWNTNDVFGDSAINFDGWRYLAVPLPGHYPGGYHWPATSQWRHDGDGVVHYPLRFRRLIVEMPEKVLQVRHWGPVERPEIYLTELVAAQGDTVRLKTNIGEW